MGNIFENFCNLIIRMGNMILGNDARRFKSCFYINQGVSVSALQIKSLSHGLAKAQILQPKSNQIAKNRKWLFITQQNMGHENFEGFS